MATHHSVRALPDTPAEYVAALELPIPTPKLDRHSFRLVCDLEAVKSLGEGAAGDGGQFNWVGFTGGHFQGTWGSGEVVRGGQDSQHILPASHPSAPYSALLSTRYLLKMKDENVYIQLQTRGWRTGPPEVMARLSAAAREGFEGACPTPDEYKFRLFVEMETDTRNPKYAWLNQAMFVGSGVRSGRQVIYDAYQVE
ncbi:outer membrane protein, beta-barrel domain containing protein [Pseudohyphozyma bogoriensis]|nr:outer membrane protein, beta-barrel domain containing protein [Pseudohyphozyma bogoriensis]